MSWKMLDAIGGSMTHESIFPQRASKGEADCDGPDQNPPPAGDAGRALAKSHTEPRSASHAWQPASSRPLSSITGFFPQSSPKKGCPSARLTPRRRLARSYAERVFLV